MAPPPDDPVRMLLAVLSPLRHEHVNLLGRYQFSLADELLRGGLRPLRRPGLLDDD